MTDTGSFPALRPSATGSFPAVRSRPLRGGRVFPLRVTPHAFERPSSREDEETFVPLAARLRARERRHETLTLVLLGVGMFLLCAALTFLAAYSRVAPAWNETGGISPLTGAASTASLPAPNDTGAAPLAAISLSEEDYAARLLPPIPAESDSAEEDIAPAQEIEAAPAALAPSASSFPTDEEGRFILATSSLPDTYEVTVESEQGVFVYKTLTVTEDIPFETEYRDARDLPKGTEVVQTEGRAGQVTTTTRETYLNGVLQEKEILDRTVHTQVISRVVLRGVGQAVTGSDGKSYAYTKQLGMKATCYYRDEVGGNRTASGKMPRAGMIAVDPSVIPLGTRVYIDAPVDRFDGVYTAEDTGGAIRGNIIDIFMETRADAVSFGTRSVKVYILE